MCRYPAWTGGPFLAELEKMGLLVKKIHVYILSAFTNSRDRNLARTNPIIKGFFNKPLSAANVKSISCEIEDKSVPDTLS